MKTQLREKTNFLVIYFFSLKIVELIILELTSSGLSESTLGCHEKRENLL